MAREGPITSEYPERFFVDRDLLYREVLVNPKRGGESIHRQLVIPFKYREKIIEKGHADTFAAHLGIARTKQRIAQNFYWPRMGKQIRSYFQSGDICQRQGAGNDKTKAKLCRLSII